MSSRFSGLREQRVGKLATLREKGIDPYPARVSRIHTVAQARALSSDETAVVAGRVMAVRSFGRACFIDLRDGSGKIQLHLREDELGGRYALLSVIDRGDFLSAEGKLFNTKTGEKTLNVERFSLISKSLSPLPEKWHGLSDAEKRYRQRYLDFISHPEVKEIFEVRARVISEIRRFLDARGFLEVETATLLPVASGAAAKPFSTYHHALGQELYLRIALELYLKRLIIGGWDKVYEIGKVFRNEGISIKHNPEFTLLESYQAYADYQDVASMVEEMIPEVSRHVLGTTRIDYEGNTINLSSPWKRITLREAIMEKCEIDIDEYPDADTLRGAITSKLAPENSPIWEGKVSWGKLADKLLSTYVEPYLIQPTFILDYPVDISPLAKRKRENPKLVERFELFIGGMEMANAFSELNDPLDQRERFRQVLHDEEEIPDEDFMEALEYGMPPTGGLGIGIDRLVMLLTHQTSIREVILFPQLREKE
jgi:lysyl-tRNA synthetase class 2